MPDLTRTTRTLATAAVAALASLIATVAPAAAQDAGGPVDLGAYGGSVRLVGDAGTTFELSDGRRFADTLEVRVQPDGDLQLINDLSIEQYVEGLNEVPARWPEEALKAQAVAARTYAWYQTELGTFQRRGLGYDICATTACQVFNGREVVETPDVGQRWADAVADTAGQVLTFEDEPILARFFSTSGGQTQDNEEVFTSEGPRPYLKGVPDPDDAVSPLHTWQVTFTREQLDAILSQGQTLGPATPLADIRREPVEDAEDRIVVTGKDGTTAAVGASAFRFFVSREAPQLYPDDFPSQREDGGSLPAALPSSRIDFTVRDDVVVVDGRGWGHGVGMGQYGALGKAQRGLAYDEILAAYYNGLRPTTPDALPQRVKVGMEDDVEELTVTADAPFRVIAGGTQVTPRGLGTWTIRDRGDRSIGLIAPAGYGAPLTVSDTEASRTRPSTVEVVRLETVVNKPSELRFDVVTADGTTVRTRDLGIVDPGRHAVTWSLDDDGGEPVPPGEYAAVITARDEDDTTAGRAAAVEVVAPSIGTEPQPTLLSTLADAPAPDRGPDLIALTIAAALGLAVGGAGAALARPSRP